jgi:putative transposase
MEKGKRNGRFLTDQDEAMARYRMIKPFLEDGVPLPDLAERHGLSVRTARRWVKRYREHGVAGLQRQPRADLGNPRQLPTVLQGVIEALALQKPRLTIAAIHREVTQLAVDKHLSVPSYSTVYSVVRQLDPALVTLAHDGIKAYGEAFDLLYRREAKAANAIWQADHNILDVLLIDETGKARKPWLTVIIDDYSRVVCGTFLSFKAPCALHTALALRQAIWRKHDPAWPVCGIPQVLYTDHGSDFTSRHIEQVCADLKIRLVFSQSGQPRGLRPYYRYTGTSEARSGSLRTGPS